MLPGLASPAKFELPKIEFLLASQTFSQAQTIAWPTVQKGDLAILFDFAYSGSNPTPVTPTGFSSIQAFPTSGWNVTSALSYKKCDGTETGNISGTTGTNSIRKNLLIFRPNRYWDTATATLQGQAGSNGTPASLTMGASGLPGVIFIFGYFFNSNSGSVSFSSSVPMSATYIDNGYFYSGYLLIPFGSTAQTVTFSAADQGSNNILGCAALQINIA